MRGRKEHAKDLICSYEDTVLVGSVPDVFSVPDVSYSKP